MKGRNKSSVAILCATLAVGLFFSHCQNSTKNKNKETVEKAEEASSYNETSTFTLCKANWFPHSQTPPPEEGNGSPFDTSSTTNQIFHQWSWQKFLWLTKPVNGAPLFESKLTQVTNQLIPIINSQKGASLILTDVGQAGSDGILMSNKSYNQQPKADTVYYSIYGNQKLISYADSMKKVSLNDPTQLTNDLTFPIGALELKMSWVKASSIPESKRSSYYQKLAYITTQKDTFNMALLGVHVVGVVKNHPEFIWATFEHNAMAPKYDWASTTTSDVPVTASNNMLFFDKDASATIKNIQYDKTTTPFEAENVFTIFPYGIPRSAGNAFMSGTSQNDMTNQSNLDHILDLNECVANSLDDKDVWKNYFYNGSIWLNTDGLSHQQQVAMMVDSGYNIGNSQKGGSTRGSLAAFNITMETFAQCFGVKEINQMQANNLTNCLSCHTAKATIKLKDQKYNGVTSPLYFSHVYRSLLSKSAGVEISEIEKLRIKEMVNHLEAQKKK